MTTSNITDNLINIKTIHYPNYDYVKPEKLNAWLKRKPTRIERRLAKKGFSK